MFIAYNVVSVISVGSGNSIEEALADTKNAKSYHQNQDYMVVYEGPFNGMKLDQLYYQELNEIGKIVWEGVKTKNYKS